MLRVFHPSVWLGPVSEPGAALRGDLDCGVVVIGGGYAGLCAALRSAEAGADVVVLESEHVGFGASGRNAGHLTPTIGKDIATVLRVYGKEAGGALVRLGDESVEFAQALIGAHRIACDYVPNGNILAGLHNGQEKMLRATAEAAARAGMPSVFLSGPELAERGVPRFVACGVHEARGGVLDPGKYLLGLRDAAVTRGVRIFEQSRALAVEEHRRGVTVTTAHGTILAQSAVLAANTWTGRLGFQPGGGLLPVAVSMFVTEPLTAEQRQRVGWTFDEGVYTAHQALENFRTTADGRILGGSRYIRHSYGGSLPPTHSQAVFEKIVRLFRLRFPELADVRIDGCWGGHIDMNLSFLPWVGHVSPKRRVVAAVGFNGHGVGMASLLGANAAEVALGIGDPPKALAERWRVPVPPEPIRWLCVSAIDRGLALADKVTDRRASPRTR
ncbi:MAG: NAD(P)/FAD-dependent oxidoreductase [Segniliparus sp.]|uniref:NAD(P)/FAD-dependent oxidoreductase n=1 Tax=Segniliparus sp. TaxID=2804064 RepID=UPI003F32821C